MKLMITLDDTRIISITEMLILIHLSTVNKNLTENLMAKIEEVPELHFVLGMDEQAIDNLFSFLRAPLKNPTFQQKLREHFETHPIEEVRDYGWTWLQAIHAEES